MVVKYYRSINEDGWASVSDEVDFLDREGSGWRPVTRREWLWRKAVEKRLSWIDFIGIVIIAAIVRVMLQHWLGWS
jgi:hypothetical protein